MLVTIRLSVQTGERIERLIRAGKYASFEDFARLALENQLVAEADSLPLWGAALRSAVAGTSTEPTAREADLGATTSVMPKAEMVPTPQPGTAPAKGAPQALLAELRSQLSAPGGRTPVAVAANPAGAENWPWGQWNRFFPVKFACRVILCIAKDGRWASTGPALEEIGSRAQTTGRALTALDKSVGRGRDDALAVAFPGSDAKSVDRFVSQFVGHITKSGPRAGAASVYQMCSLGDAGLGLTESGIAFAQMTNPLLDGTHDVDSLLSREERKFLVELIGGRVPGERAAFLAVMGAVNRGAKRFDDVVKEARKSGPKSWSEAMARTQVSGTLARLNDLNLIEKERQGQIVKYALTSEGETLLRRWRKGE